MSEIGCPAISIKDGKADIDKTLCVGCGTVLKCAGLTLLLNKTEVLKNMETKSIMIVGVGGQGSLLASRIIGNVLLSQGYDVKVSEVHGMSQRGGSVVTYVKYGDKVYSPVIEKGEADIIVSFELLEAARWVSYLKKNGHLITSTQTLDPMPVITGNAEYPLI